MQVGRCITSFRISTGKGLHASGNVKYFDKGDTDIRNIGILSLLLSEAITSASPEFRDSPSQGDSMV